MAREGLGYKVDGESGCFHTAHAHGAFVPHVARTLQTAVEHTHAFQCWLRSISELMVYKSTRKEKSLGTVDLSEKLVV